MSFMRAAIVALAVVAQGCVPTTSGSATVPPATQTARTASPPPATTRPAATTAPPPIVIESVIGSDDITLTLSTPVSRGQTARATVTTLPHAFCSITVTYASVHSTAAGLAAKDADGSGFVSWSWTVEPSVPPGSWPVEVSCQTVSGLRAVARQMLVVI